jgi:hypothetical protein
MNLIALSEKGSLPKGGSKTPAVRAWAVDKRYRDDYSGSGRLERTLDYDEVGDGNPDR